MRDARDSRATKNIKRQRWFSDIQKMSLVYLVLSALAFCAPVTSTDLVTYDPLKGPAMPVTPGALCSPQNKDYKEFVYGIHKCSRNFGKGDKTAVAAPYGITSQGDWKKYKFDHLIPLSIGGSNSRRNVWPLVLGTPGAAKEALEQTAFNLLSSGKINQEEAIKMIVDQVNLVFGFTGSKAYTVQGIMSS